MTFTAAIGSTKRRRRKPTSDGAWKFVPSFSRTPSWHRGRPSRVRWRSTGWLSYTAPSSASAGRSNAYDLAGDDIVETASLGARALGRADHRRSAHAGVDPARRLSGVRSAARGNPDRGARLIDGGSRE